MARAPGIRRCKDYDNRNALHIAAAEGRLLAVSYLMSNSFSPHFVDRWGATALDDALKGQTMYHMYCAKLIQSMGGQVSLLKDTEEGARVMEAVEALPIDDVRKRLMYLNRAGYNQIVPKPVVEDEVLSAHQRCLAHLPLVQAMISTLQTSAERCTETAAALHAVAARLDAQVSPVCRMLYRAQLGHADAMWAGQHRSVRSLLPDASIAVAEGDAQGSPSRVSMLQEGGGGCRRYMVSKLTKMIRKAIEADDLDAEARLQVDLAWDELIAAGETQPLQGVEALDLDEEAELFAMVDNLMAEREFCDAFGIERNLYKAHRFQNLTLRIADLETMYARLCAIFAYCRGGTSDALVLLAPPPDGETLVSVEDLVAFFDVLGVEAELHVAQFEIEAMFEAALAFGNNAGSQTFGATLDRPDEECVSLRRLVAGSEEFRAAILRLPVDEAYGLTMQKSRLCDLVGEPLLRDLCKAGSVRIAGKGELLFDSRRQKSNMWCVVIGGNLCLSLNVPTGDEDVDLRYLSNGSMLGGYGHLADGKAVDCSIRCSSGCQIVELPVEGLLSLKQAHPAIAEKLAAEMEETPGKHGVKDAAEADSQVAVWQATGTKDNLQSLLAPAKQAADDTDRSTLGGASAIIDEDQRSASTSAESRESTPAPKSPVTLLDLYIINSGFKCISDVWHSIAGGEPCIRRAVLHSMQTDLGEVGSGIFRQIFLPDVKEDAGSEAFPLSQFKDMNASEFWGCWMRLLLDRTSNEFQRRQSLQDARFEFLQSSGERPVPIERAAPENGWVVSLFSSRGSLLRHQYLEKKFVDSGRYQEAYVQTVGSLNPALMDDNIPVYISNLFPHLAHEISYAHCVEFKDIFGKNGTSSVQVSWTDIKKVLQPILSVEVQSVFLGTVFHPQSKYMTWFWYTMQLVAAYHFVSVPLLLCFVDDSARMDSNLSMSVFIPVDILTFLSTLIQLNTAYKSSRRNVWETNRLRIAKKLGNIGMIPALPLDWIFYALGLGYEASLWIRMSKLLVIFQVLGRGVGLKARTSVIRHVLYQILVSLAVLHMCCCFWYFIARKYPLLDPQNPFVWYKPDYPEDDPRYRPNTPFHTNAFEYDQLSCNQTQAAQCSPKDSWYYFGMQYTDGIMAKYIISLYYVSTRITNQNLYGNIVPENFLEVGFSIIFMVFNLTLFRLVIGDLSTLVMQSDAGKFDARTRSMKIFSFISKNNFSAELANEIRLYCENANDHGSSAKCARVLRFLPRFLQDEVSRHVCRDLLDRTELLAGCSDHFKDLLCSAIGIKAFTAEEYLFRIGEVAEDLYIVQAGTVDTVVESAQSLTGEKVVSVVGVGIAVEQVAFFFQLRFIVSARAAREGGAVCLRVGRESFLQILKCFPIDEELVSQNVLRIVSSTRVARSGGSIASFISEKDKEGSKTMMTGKSGVSDITSGRNGKKNKQSIEHVEDNRKKMKMLLLFSAVKAGDLGTVQWCLKSGLLSVNDCDDCGRCLLHVAACEGNEEIAAFLLQASANVDFKDHRGNTPLNDAVLGCQDRIASLIRKHAPGTRLSFDGSQAGTKLCEAAGAGDLAQVTRLLENGVEVNAHDYDGRTGLHLAACEGRAEVVEHLLAARADAAWRDKFGNTALDDAIRHGHASIKQLVYDAGARVSGMSNVLKACAASAEGGPRAIELTKNLVDNGLDPKAGDYDGRTPLHLAACSGKLGILEYFISKIQAGAAAGAGEEESHFNVVDRYGYTPLDDADRHGNEAAIVLLEAAGAMRRGNARLTEFIAARKRRDHDRQQVAMRDEAATRLTTSRESLVWTQVRPSSCRTICVSAWLELCHVSMTDAC